MPLKLTRESIETRQCHSDVFIDSFEQLVHHWSVAIAELDQVLQLLCSCAEVYLGPWRSFI